MQPHFLAAIFLYVVFRALTTGVLQANIVTLFLAAGLAFLSLVMNGGIQTVPLFVMPLAVDIISRQDPGKVLKSAKFAALFLLFGVALNILAEGVLASMVSNYRGSALRGINSFTSEPSYLGICGMVLAAVFLFLSSGAGWVFLAAVLSLASGSLTAVAPLFIMFALKFLKVRTAGLLVGLAVVCWYGAGYIATTQTRIGFLVADLWYSPELILLDVSFSNRFIRAIGPIMAAFNDWFIPHDFSEPFYVGVNFLASEADDYVERLSSVATVLIYGLGFFSLPLVGVYFWVARAPVFYWFAVLYLATTNISVATPYLYVALALPLMGRHAPRKMPKALAKALSTP
ncbi:MAG: hypothetical protein ACU0BN_02810 [Sulfitobacter sp.]